MRLVLLGDIHLFSTVVRARQLISKRIFAHTNLMLNRRHRFNHAVLAATVERVAELAPDMLLLSGDVSTSSLDREFEDLKRYLAPLAEKMPAVLVPGNHDRYTFRSRRIRRIETQLDGMMPVSFPHHRRLTDRWSMLALDAAIPNRVFSRGALGKAQLKIACDMVRNTPASEGLVVLCHYPCAVPRGTPRGWTHDLAEHRHLRQALSECPGRVVYLHGHIHRPWYAPPEVMPSVPNGAVKQPRLPFLCINAGSPCLTSDRYPAGQGFWELYLPEDPHAPLPAVHHRPELQKTSGKTLLEDPHGLRKTGTTQTTCPWMWVQTHYPAGR